MEVKKVCLIYCLYKNEYKIFKLLSHHKKWTKVERRKIEELKPILVIKYLHIEMSQSNSLM
jgi:hypothetical protein